MKSYVDADHALKVRTWRYVPGGVVMCAGACVFEYSRTQKSIMISSPEAAYVPMGTAFHELFLFGASGVLYSRIAM